MGWRSWRVEAWPPNAKNAPASTVRKASAGAIAPSPQRPERNPARLCGQAHWRVSSRLVAKAGGARHQCGPRRAAVRRDGSQSRRVPVARAMARRCDMDGPVARVGRQRPQDRQSAERQPWPHQHRVREQDAEPGHVHHEPLHLPLGSGQILVLQVPGDDAGVVRAVPAPGPGSAEEVHPALDAAGTGGAGGAGGQQECLGLVQEQPSVDSAPPGTQSLADPIHFRRGKPAIVWSGGWRGVRLPAGGAPSWYCPGAHSAAASPSSARGGGKGSGRTSTRSSTCGSASAIHSSSAGSEVPPVNNRAGGQHERDGQSMAYAARITRIRS